MQRDRIVLTLKVEEGGQEAKNVGDLERVRKYVPPPPEPSEGTPSCYHLHVSPRKPVSDF